MPRFESKSKWSLLPTVSLINNYFKYICISKIIHYELRTLCPPPISLNTYYCYLFIYRCEHGILSTYYPSSELMPYQGVLEFPSIDYNPNASTITLREAAQTQRDRIRCNCSSNCKKGRCSCRSAGLDCSSHCHPRNSSCLNKKDITSKDSSEDECIITKVESSDVVSDFAKRKRNLQLRAGLLVKKT